MIELEVGFNSHMIYPLHKFLFFVYNFFLKVDDPVGATVVHGIGGIWGVWAVGLFAEDPLPLETTSGRKGLFKGGGW